MFTGLNSDVQQQARRLQLSPAGNTKTVTDRRRYGLSCALYQCFVAGACRAAPVASRAGNYACTGGRFHVCVATEKVK